MRGDIDGTRRLTAYRVEGVEFFSGGEPDVLAVIRNAMHGVDARKGSVFVDDLGR
jgi:hypothetical protein